MVFEDAPGGKKDIRNHLGVKDALIMKAMFDEKLLFHIIVKQTKTSKNVHRGILLANHIFQF